MSLQQTVGFYCYVLVILFYIYFDTKILGRASLDVYELYLPWLLGKHKNKLNCFHFVLAKASTATVAAGIFPKPLKQSAPYTRDVRGMLVFASNVMIT
jgi:hypothetical protein